MHAPGSVSLAAIALLLAGCAEPNGTRQQAVGAHTPRTLGATLVQPIRPALRPAQRQRWEARTGGMRLFFADGELGVALPLNVVTDPAHSVPEESVVAGTGTPHVQPGTDTWGLRWSLVDGRTAIPEMHRAHPARVNVYLGSDPAQWREQVECASQLRYPDILPDVDLIVGTTANGYTYRLHAGPGALPPSLSLRYAGARGIVVDDDGRGLTVITGAGTVRETGLAVYQLDDDGQRIERPARYLAVADSDAYRIIADGLDTRWRTVIDPEVNWTSYAGGAGFDDIASIAHSSSDRLVFAGTTLSGDYPTPGGYDTTLGGTQDAYLTAIVPSTPSILWSTYLGGDTGTDSGLGVALSGLGPAIVGHTSSIDFPVQGAFGPTPSTAPDAFAATFNTNGSLRWSGYLAGDGTDVANGVAINSTGMVFVVGTSASTDLPTPNGFDTVGDAADDGYIAAIASDGSQLVWASYVGEAGADALNAITVHPLGDLLIAGDSESDMALPNGFDTVRNGVDGLLLRVAATGSGILWGSYVGGSSWDRANAVAFGPGGDLYVGGITATAELATAGAYDTTLAGANDAFVMQINEPTGAVVWGTLLGGNSGNVLNKDELLGLAVDPLGRVYFAGFSNNPDFPTLGGLDDTLTQVTDGDGIAGQLSADGATLVWATFLGGDAGSTTHDSATSAALGPDLTFYVGGRVQSTDMVVTGGWDETRAGNQDGFLIALGDPGSAPPTISFILASPPSVDLTAGGVATIACSFSSPRVGASASDFALTLRTRGPDDLTETLLCNAVVDGGMCVGGATLSVTGGPVDFTAGLVWAPASTMTPGLYDLACKVDDNVDGLSAFADFDQASDVLTLVGGVSTCTPVALDDGSCDGVDDDCDGTLDEDAATTGECVDPTFGPCDVPRCDVVAGNCSVSELSGCCSADSDCFTPSACVVGSCDLASNNCGLALPANCCSTPNDCDDGNACTTERCSGDTGTCVVADIGGCCLSDADCDDGNACSLGTCASSRRCSYAPTGCDSGTACGSDPGCTYAAVWLDRIEQTAPLPALRREADAAVLGLELRADALAGRLTAVDVVIESAVGALPPGALRMSLHAGGPNGPRLAEVRSDPSTGAAMFSGLDVELEPASSVRLWIRARPTAPVPAAALLLLAVGLVLSLVSRGGRRHALLAVVLVGIGIGATVACSRSGYNRVTQVRAVIPSAQALTFDSASNEVLEVFGAPVEGELFDASW